MAATERSCRSGGVTWCVAVQNIVLQSRSRSRCGVAETSDDTGQVKAHRTTVRELLHKLSAANRVVISGARQFTRYSLPDAERGAHEERAGKAHTKKRASAKKKATKAQQRAAIPAVLTQADYDAAVLANLNATGSMSSCSHAGTAGGIRCISQLPPRSGLFGAAVLRRRL